MFQFLSAEKVNEHVLGGTYTAAASSLLLVDILRFMSVGCKTNKIKSVVSQENISTVPAFARNTEKW